MTREELKTIKDLVMDMGKDIQGQRHYQHWEAYDKDEADSVMDAMEKRIHELEFEKGMLEVKADARGAIIKLNEERITMLKKHLEDVQYTMATENTDLGMENIKLKERIKELEASQPKWISVEDRFPNDEYDEVLVDLHEISDFPIAGVERVRTFQFFTDSIEYDADNDCGIFNDVEGMEKYWFTHWMPLPPLPTTEKTSAVQPPKSED